MTQQYLVGELSLRLAQLEAVCTDQAASAEIVHLRQEAESAPLSGLASVVRRALQLTDGTCWETLERGDVGAFARGVDVFSQLWEFGLAAGLLTDAGC